ncbi:unnamed protein product [Ambrosiozyma monospora]|uniref:Unnamed protein product n=1 Tax=Ambrosiozyma monospora TaxID=43982 RepID=A0A9W6T2F7_AMBMO|nr:unnamed protein product [Ambrosiozyma monospora]
MRFKLNYLRDEDSQRDVNSSAQKTYKEQGPSKVHFPFKLPAISTGVTTSHHHLDDFTAETPKQQAVPSFEKTSGVQTAQAR